MIRFLVFVVIFFDGCSSFLSYHLNQDRCIISQCESAADRAWYFTSWYQFIIALAVSELFLWLLRCLYIWFSRKNKSVLFW